MSNRYLGGYLTASYNPLLVPNAPTIGTATAGDTSVSVAFTAPSNVGGGPITSYVAVSSPGGFTGTASASPVTVTGLTNGTAYTFQVFAINAYGSSDASASSNSVTPSAPSTRGLFGGGVDVNSTTINVISYITIDTTGNATDFGDLTLSRSSAGACSSTTRAIWGGGNAASVSNVIDYVTILSTGNATDFGDLTSTAWGNAGCSNSTRGLINLGYTGSAYSSSINYVTIASTGNATTFGSLTTTCWNGSACSSSTRGIFGGGYRISGNSNIIDYVTIDTTGNATDFGDLTVQVYALSSCSNSTRGLFFGGTLGSGASAINISYITIASTGNATNFGDLLSVTAETSACSNSTRATIAGTYNPSANPTRTNVIQYVTIASTGNAIDFGDLTLASSTSAGCSNGHGGLA